MSNLVQKVNFQLPGSPEIEMYMYGEATLEANQEMQPVLEKLYKYERIVEQYDLSDISALKQEVEELIGTIK